MRVPWLDLPGQYRGIRDEVLRAIAEVLETQQFVLGPRVAALEAAIAARCGTRFGVGVASGTDALVLALKALDIGPGDEVLTTALSFGATATAIAMVGARPVFADIDPATFTLDPKQVEARITTRTRAIIPVHLYGQCADMEPILAVAGERQIAVVEDAAQALGAGCPWADGSVRRAGSMGRAGALSFFPTKNLGAYGDAGMVVTSDEALARRIANLRVHGRLVRGLHGEIGLNSRLDELQAAILLVKLRHLDAWHAARAERARRYDALLAERGLTDVCVPPTIRPGQDPVFHLYVVRVPRRDALRQFLAERGIATEVYYERPLHLQPCFAALGHREGDFPEAERAAREVLALPLYPELSEPQQEAVVEAIAAFFERRRA
jgi:dTDP-4-amino-4,6-dideoxygalactose transaminase